MATEIINNGSSLKIVTDDASRFILKNQIREVEVVRDTIIKIDIGQGALYNVFIDQAEVTNPVSQTVDGLRDQIVEMLQTTVSAGLATEAKQIEEITHIQTLQDSVSGLNDKVLALDGKLFYEPSVIDESNANLVYEGYAAPGSQTSAPVWAVLKITNSKGVLTHEWAGGNKSFNKVWDDRATLIFS